ACGNVRVLTCSNQCIEVQLQIFAELQSSIRVGQRHRALNVTGHGFARSVGKVIQWKDDDVVTAADATVLPTISPKSRYAHFTTLPFLSYEYGRGRPPRYRQSHCRSASRI